jgi:crotonobetainyl-CoA hydratase
MRDEPVRTACKGPILEVVLDRPKANAIDAATSRCLGAVFTRFRDDPALRVAIITGGGAKFFSAGWDLVASAAGEPADADYGPGGFGGIQEMPRLNKPIIAAVNGLAVGGGFELALSADLIIAAEHARFALPEITAGTLAEAATIRLPRRIPYHIAMELLLVGRWMDSREAYERGIVNEVVAAGDLMPRARLPPFSPTVRRWHSPRSKRCLERARVCASWMRWRPFGNGDFQRSKLCTRATIRRGAPAPLPPSGLPYGTAADP